MPNFVFALKEKRVVGRRARHGQTGNMQLEVLSRKEFCGLQAYRELDGAATGGVVLMAPVGRRRRLPMFKPVKNLAA